MAPEVGEGVGDLRRELACRDEDQRAHRPPLRALCGVARERLEDGQHERRCLARPGLREPT